ITPAMVSIQLSLLLPFSFSSFSSSFFSPFPLLPPSFSSFFPSFPPLLFSFPFFLLPPLPFSLSFPFFSFLFSSFFLPPLL
ncbi:hypothetical protein ACXWRW_11160, partial [Streptococcus pyogenes]